MDVKYSKTAELIKKLVLAWDPDYTKVTPDEFISIQNAEREIERGEVFGHDEIDWE